MATMDYETENGRYEGEDSLVLSFKLHYRCI